MAAVMHSVHPNNLFKTVEAVLESRPTLDALEVAVVECMLYKAIQKLSIVQQILPSPNLSQGECYESMSLRMTKLKKITLPVNEEHVNILQLKHIQKCRHFLQNIFEETAQELYFQGTHHFMEYIVCCENFKNYDNIYLEYEFNDLNNLILHLRQNIASNRESFNKILPYLSALNSPCSEQAIVRVMIESAILNIYTDSNEQAKLDQNRYKLQEKERFTQKAIDNLFVEEKEDILTSYEIENHITKNTLRLQKKLSRWTTRYNNEIEILDVALLQTKSRLEDQREHYNELLQIYTERHQVMATLLEEIETKDRLVELKVLRIKAATMIQLWWRSILFQRFINKRIVFKKLKKIKALSKKKSKKK